MTATSSPATEDGHSSLWRHPNFQLLWAGRTIDLFATHVAMLAIPYTAAVVLDASPMQMGLLTALGFAPWLLFGLLAGAVVDRTQRRLVMVIAGLARALLILTIPAAALLDSLTFWHLALVALSIGVLAVFFQTASGAIVPSIVTKDQLIDANAKLNASRSVMTIAGPSAGGFLVQLLTAPIALIVNAVCDVVSALFIVRLRAREPRSQSTDRRRIRSEISDGIRFLLRQPILRALAGESATGNLGASMMLALIVLFATRDLKLSAGEIGAVMALGGAGGVVATLLTGRVAGWLGIGRTLTASCVVAAAGVLLMPAAGGSRLLILAVLAMAYFLYGGSVTTFAILAGSLRQAVTPDRMMGRVLASTGVAITGMSPVGALLGGLLGTVLGVRPTLAIAGALTLAATLWIAGTQVGRLQSLPAIVDDMKATDEQGVEAVR